MLRPFFVSVFSSYSVAAVVAVWAAGPDRSDPWVWIGKFGVGMLAGLHLGNACTAIIAIYRHGMKRLQEPDHTV